MNPTSPMTRTLAILLLLLAPLAAHAKGPAFPLHGHWCGLGQSGGPLAAAPIDPLDAACMRHDICTAQRGRLDCGCDIGFMRELRDTRWPNPGIADKARAIHDSIAVMPCSSPAGMAWKAACLSGDLARDTVTGREMPMDVLRRWARVGTTGLSNSYWQR